MSSMCAYLVPKTSYTSHLGEEHPQPTLDALVRELVDAQQLALHSAHDLMETTLYPQALATAHAQTYASQWGQGVALCLLKSLRMICVSVLAMSRGQLLKLARHLDTNSIVRMSTDAAWDDFCALLRLLRKACCQAGSDDCNLLADVQTLIPLLSKLSSQIDKESIAQPTPSAALAAFNSQVQQVLATAQNIVNVMSDWQDQLTELLEIPPKLAPIHFYEDQVQAGIQYWQAMHATLTLHLADTEQA